MIERDGDQPPADQQHGMGDLIGVVGDDQIDGKRQPDQGCDDGPEANRKSLSSSDGLARVF